MKANKFTVTLIFTLIFSICTAQSKKLDRIIKKDYNTIECIVSKLSDKIVEYSLPNESLIIQLDITQIARIEFANGRVQNFLNATGNEKATADEKASSLEIKPNTVAVLPVPYVNSSTTVSSEEMAKFAQEDIYNKLIDKSSNIFPLTIQDLRTTNSLLRKAGIDYKNIDETPINDLHNILGVDNIIAAKISYTINQNQQSSTYSSGNVKINNDGKKAKGNEISTTSSHTSESYDYHVYFDMYKNGSKIYTQSRKPILKLKDSWMDSITYLLKRSPIYVKK